MRTLIVAQGLEYERILAAVNIHSPNKVIMLRSKKDVTPELSQQIEKHISRVKEYIFSERNGLRLFPFIREVDADSHHIDFFDIPSAMAEIVSIIKNEIAQKNQVSVDISSGNKVVAIALFLASQLLDIPITYCTAGKYASMNNTYDSLKQIAFSVQKSLNLQKLPLSLMPVSWDILKRLSQVDEIGSMSELLLLMKREKNKSNLITISRQLELLSNLGYISQAFKGRGKRVRITDSGKSVINLMRVIEESKAVLSL